MPAAADTPPAAVQASSQPTIVIDLIVEDAKGRPALNLQADEIIVMQDGTQQRVAALEAREPPGQYELRYVPASGASGAVTLQLLRPGTRARGLDGPVLKPRVVMPLSPLETELVEVLAARPEAADFPAHAAVLRFESASDGLHHTIAVEVPLAGLKAAQGNREVVGRLQILARITDAKGRLVQRAHVERSLSAATEAELLSQRLVWTSQVHLRPGRYVLETVARDAATSRAAVHRIAFEAAEPAAGVRVSSIALLLPIGSLVLRDRGSEQDDPFFLQGQALMPTLELKTVAAPAAKVEFFTIVYPDRASADPVSLQLELVRDGKTVATAPVALPPPDEHGEIRYAGSIPTRTLKVAAYRLRLRAQQGAGESFEEVPFSVLDGSAAPQIRLSDVPARPITALETVGRLLKQRRYLDALQALKNLENAAESPSAEAALLLALTYYRLRDYQHAETAALRAVELGKSDQAIQSEGYALLGRTLAESEQKLVHKDSERLRAAEQAFRSALAANNTSETAPIVLAETLYRLERADDARTVLQQLAQRQGLSEAAAARARQLLQNPRCATETCLPELSFVTQDGRHRTPEELRGKVVLLSFWATWCAPCVKAIPDLKQLQSKYSKDPFLMVGINLDSDHAKLDGFLKGSGVTWPQIADDTSEHLGETMGVRGIPAEFLFDHEGVLVGTTTGWGAQTFRALLMRVDHAVGKAKKAKTPSS